MKLSRENIASLGFCDLHTHTFYCDGKDSPEDMVKGAICKNLDTIGIVCHSFVKGEEDWCIKNSDYKSFYDEVERLKEKYQQKIKILCGVERDYYTDEVPDIFDYTIGSVHILEKSGKLYSIDESAEKLLFIKKELFNDSWVALYECYYKTLSNIVEKTDCDIIGHFDVIVKFNEKDKLFSTSSEFYKQAWMGCADKLLSKNRIFEVNSGGMSRGYLSHFYPEKPILDYLILNGACVVYTSDSHNKNNVAFALDNLAINT